MHPLRLSGAWHGQPAVWRPKVSGWGALTTPSAAHPCGLLIVQRLVGERDRELRAHALSLKGLTRRLGAAQQARQEAEKLATELLQEHEEASEGDAEAVPAGPQASAASLGGLSGICPAVVPHTEGLPPVPGASPASCSEVRDALLCCASR